ncbi:hypothetical protein CAI21_22555, partial [Alkalilimnicola ehrlichii]
MDILLDFVDALSSEGIHEHGRWVSTVIGATVTPVLLTVAVAIRLFTGQLDVLSGSQGKWVVAVRDMLIWTSVLALYFLLIQILLSF